MVIVALDIETIPDETQLAYRVQNPEKFCARKDRDDWGDDANEKAYRKQVAAFADKQVKVCSLDPDYGCIASVAMWDGTNGGTLHLGEFGGDETALLRELWKFLATVDGIVTFNGVGFDWRWIRERTILNGLHIPKSFDTPKFRFWPNCDLMLIRADWERDRWRGLAETCRLFGVTCEGKESGMDGSQVYQFAQDGRWEEIAAYNLSDAKATWDLFRILADRGRIPALAARRGEEEAA